MSTPVFLRSLVLLLAALPLLGCATWSKHGVIVSAQEPLRVAVLPLATTATVSKLSDITSVAATTHDIEEAEVIRQELERAASQIDHQLAGALAAQANIAAVPLAPLPDATTIYETVWNGGRHGVSSLPLPAATQAVLLVRLAGYGKIKGEWLTYLIGAGVVEGVVQGVLVAQAVSTPWAGVAVAAEEIGQEVLVWGGGARLFDAYYAPVTLEAKLVSVDDGAVIWTDTVFVAIDKPAIEKLAEPDRRRKELQLAATAAKAVRELVANFRDAVAGQIPGTRADPAQLSQLEFTD